ncbi:hypothetical protein B566_EDAN015091 [Ephemera danica]|nr:hypothetical protein B566_EDAN015091 [Ephemera danica]
MVLPSFDNTGLCCINHITMSPRNTKDGSRRGKKLTSGGQENFCGDDDNDNDYRRRRERNNEAVKKSRVKSKLRTQQTLERVHKLKTENEMLEEKIKILTKELEFLKELFFAHTGTASVGNLDPSQIEMMLKATSQDDNKAESSSSRRTRQSSIEERKDRF